MSKLDAKQCALLDLVLDVIVPPSADGRMPGAAELAVGDYLQSHAADAIAQIGRALDRLENDAQAMHAKPFGALHADQRERLLDRLRQHEPQLLTRLALETFNAYYQHDRVLAALDLERRPPFPHGYHVLSGDLSLLEPVRKRGKMFRDA